MPSTRVSPYYRIIFSSQVSKVQRYIEDQVEPHRKRTFEGEWVELLRSGVEFHEKYL